MNTLQLSPSILDWAAGHIGLSPEVLAEEIVPKSKHESFLSGTMTVNQAEKLAKITRVPFGFLFLDSPPDLPRPSIPDLRQKPNPAPLSLDFIETLEDVLRKQDWYKSYLRETGADAPAFLQRTEQNYSADDKDVAEDIRETLGLTAALRKDCRNAEEYYSLLSAMAEQVGVLVFKSGIVKGSTRKGLDVSEFRGFALADPLAPTIFINGKDAPNAWVFTLAHELAHIWIGQSGVSDIHQVNDGPASQVEIRCNRIAAELLMPKADYVPAWQETTDNKLEALSSKFKVSKLAAARRALDVGLITWSDYLKVDEESKNFTRSGSGGNPYNTIPVRNSKKFTHALLSRSMSGHTMLREAASLLNVKPDTVVEMGRRLRARD